MSIIAALINGAARRLRSEPPASPVAAFIALEQPASRLPATAPPENVMSIYKNFVRSRLAAESDPSIVDALDVIYRDQGSQRAAGECAAKRQRLVELAGFKAEVSAAIQFAIDRGDDAAKLTPAVVAEVLRQRASDLEDAIEECREDHAAHRAASAARMLKHQSLRAAVSKHLDKSIAERTSLLQAEDAERRANRIGLTGSSRYVELRKAGLTDSQIAEVRSPVQRARNPSPRTATCVSQSWAAKLRAFADSLTLPPSMRLRSSALILRSMRPSWLATEHCRRR